MEQKVKKEFWLKHGGNRYSISMESLTAQCGTGLSREVDENRVHSSLSLVHILDVKNVGGWLLGESFGKVLLVYHEFHLTLRKAVSSPQLMRVWFQWSHIKYSTFTPCNLGAQWISVYLSSGKTWSMNKRMVSFSDDRTEAEWQFWQKKKKSMRACT